MKDYVKIEEKMTSLADKKLKNNIYIPVLETILFFGLLYLAMFLISKF